ncbi:TusA-related sulfurtransferase [Desulfonauticus submarinus]|uniref:TusA-related sulfurtransferase n=1 Tax=Desulfonauticus submarinus TaxID=206665 RepID=A0A1H0BD43_9BACT|nr:sulfurtransferase TusA family protein [Desulfonauticus submarinus]SDN43546.1 TusA-related sulfurtransferase [Desulfonauticus submarinus]
MADTVDARGLSCPQPVILALDKMKELGKGEFEIILDTRTALENVSRAAGSKGWEVEIKEESEEIIVLKIKK